ncbi:hypothetical protein [Pleomorphovibrio marinus]|uniref:hypothetical protein n=1 Tax=Pleomorphovibrio marinus TaxID=2164132 RepID=UPI000E0A502D|nr:hypothetical protein [Pleomorphovibrio marinus]
MKKNALTGFVLMVLLGCEEGDFSSITPVLEQPKEEEELEAPIINPFDELVLEDLGKGVVNHVVRDMQVLDNLFVVSGEFSSINGQFANNIGVYDSNRWRGLGAGFNYKTTQMLLHEGALYVGGHFMQSLFNQQVLNLAKWNGTSWDEVGNGLDMSVLCLGIYQGELVAGGTFTIAGIGAQDLPVQRIASWDGKRWRRLDQGLNGPPQAMTIYRGELVVAGNFSKAGGESANNIATWNGYRWDSFGNGIQGKVYDLVVFKDELYATGIFTQAGGIAVNHIAKWNGSEWLAIKDGLEATLPIASGHPVAGRTLAVYEDELWVGGSFSSAGGEATQNIAIWDGTRWHGTVEGLNSRVEVIFPYEDTIYFGGYFNHYDEFGFKGICKWERK